MPLNLTKGKKRILAPGTFLNDDLRVVDHLGGSRKVDVYLCKSKHLKRLVACKILRKKYGSERSTVKAIVREGEILQRMHHPNVAGGYRVEMEPLPHIVMQQIDGQTLDTAFLRGNYDAFDMHDFTGVALQLADALTYVHESGLLHLDVKTSNVMYHDGHSTLFDFSVAREFDPEVLLKTHAGTRAYKSPEQTNGREAGYYSDVFGLGVVFYRLLTGGELPFPDIKLEKEKGKKRKRLVDYEAGVRPLLELNPEIPEPVAEVALRALRLEPAERFATPAEFKSALEGAVQEL
ncbi:MAG: serine/threonine protein kinase [Chloroflexi bacterium]|nr:serine/threonine protein kinase [Chloroflexota bacterium]